MAPRLPICTRPQKAMAASPESGHPDQESKMSDQIKDMPEKKLDKSTADNVKGGATSTPKKVV